MPPFFSKGIVWTNVEDEILRAAISKYGLNQWSRVSSLLARKTAKQAKARWTEWLNPTIKKIEWSREEDEKLLHLAKLMPTQWRTIAPIVGRTATQCIERYQQLLEDAENEEMQQGKSSELALTGVGAEASAPAGTQPRRRIGDTDPTPESRPARPDAIDMDDDEREMLSEARARLANTQGKKAKRKDRERLLEESRRLATLQKRRELKLAGINTKITRRNRNQVDYNADIPFEHRPAPGFYDTTQETSNNFREKAHFERTTNKKGVFMQESLNKDQRGQKRYRDKEAALEAAEQAARAKAERLQDLNHADKLSKRRKLVLPSPQVQEEEIEQIVKYGSRGEKVQRMYDGEAGATQGLIGEYRNDNLLGKSRVEETPQATSAEDRISQSVREIKAMDSQAPLLDDRTEEINGSLPNLDSLPAPKGGAIPSQLSKSNTQIFDKNDLESNGHSYEGDSRSSIRRKFQSLPKPVNNFEILIPEEKEIEEESFRATDGLTQDKGEQEAEAMKKAAEAEQRELLARSQVLQKDLPRPISQNAQKLESTMFRSKSQKTAHSEDFILIAAELIQQELKKLVISDSIQYPKDITGVSSTIHGEILPSLSEAEKSHALKEIESEVENNDARSSIFAFTEALSQQPFTLPGLDTGSNDVDEGNSIPAIKTELSTHLADVATQSNTLESKLNKVMGGYAKRQEILSSKLSQSFRALSDLQVERAKEESAYHMEQIALSKRLDLLQEEVDFLTEAERRGQERYQQLQQALRSV